MAFIGLSSEYSMHGYTSLENIFINEYMPGAPDSCIKVYLYGLFLAGTAVTDDNDIDKMSARLSLEPSDIINAYSYWQELGLVQIMKKVPFEVRYTPVRSSSHTRKYKPGKYNDFNNAIQSIITGRMISSNEYHEYYSLMETHRIEQEALIMAAKYCAMIKGDNINYPYILTVARNWALEGVTTVKQVEEKLNEYEAVSDDLSQVLKALGIKRAADLDERQSYRRYTSSYGFTLPAILYAAKKCKKGGFGRLDKLLSDYYSNRVMDIKEMEAFDKNRDRLYALCRSINKLIGVYYEQLDHIVETYTVPWINKGFDDDALVMIADYCFKNNIRTLDGMNTTVNKLHKQGLLTTAAISEYLGQVLSVDGIIKEILSLAGLTRNVNSWDRDSYRTWTYSWKLNDGLIRHAAGLALGKGQPIPYMNKILSEWHDKGYTDISQVGSYTPPEGGAKQPRASDRQYSKEEWAAMIDNLDDIEF